MNEQTLFSKWVPQYYEPEEKTLLQSIAYIFWRKEQEMRINPLLMPTDDDLEQVFGHDSDFRSYCVENVKMVDGIVYYTINISVKSEVLNALKPKEVGMNFLNLWRNHWHKTRNIDCATFVISLSSNRIIFAQPVSILGLRTLAQIQHEQYGFKKNQTRKMAQKEKQIADAQKAFEKR